jgi:MATE family multidrug resistance protein
MKSTPDTAPPSIRWHQRIWSLSWPVILSNITVPLVGAVDTAVMGRQDDPAYVGAVALGATVFSAFYWVFGFLRMGTTGLVAQSYGARNPDAIAATLVRALVAAAALSTLLLLLQKPILTGALWLIEGSATVEGFTAEYFNIRIWGAPALLVHLVELGVLFGLQRMRLVLVLTLVFNLLNVVLDLWLVMGLDMGVQGVALGTTVSEWAAALLGGLFVYRALIDAGGRPSWPAQLLEAAQLKQFVGLSSNLVIRTLFVQLPFFVTTLLGARFGDVVLAANAVLMQYFFIMTFGLDGFAHAAETLTGYAVGRRDRASLRNTVVYSSIWAAMLAVVFGLLVLVFAESLIALMTSLDAVASKARNYTVWLAVLPLVAVWAFQFDGIYIGATRSRELRNGMFVALLAYLACLLPTLAILGNHALWLAMLVFMGARGLVLGLGYPKLERSLD